MIPGVGVLRAAWRGLRASRNVSAVTRREYMIALALAGLSEVAVRTLPLKRTARLMRVVLVPAPDAAPKPQIDKLPPWAAHRYRVVDHLMSRWPVEGACLRQSLVLGNRLRDLHPVLKLGVRMDDGVIKAHAWLEIDGRSLDATSHHFVELPTAV